jgi:hypothetical protein
MIVEYIPCDVDGGRGMDFGSAYREARASLDASPHCLAYELARCSEDPARSILRIERGSPERQMQDFRASPSSNHSSRRCARTSVTSRRCATTKSRAWRHG